MLLWVLVAVQLGSLLATDEAMTSTERPTTLTTEAPVNWHKLGLVKGGLALAMFASVMLACGLPVLIMDYLQRQTMRPHAVDSSRSLVSPGSNLLESQPQSEYSNELRSPPYSPTTTATPNDLFSEIETLLPPASPPHNLTTPQHFSGTQEADADGMRLPNRVNRRMPMPRRRRLLLLWASRLTCFAAGVFLSTGFLDLFPDVQEAVTKAKKQLQMNVDYPLASLFTLLGFFMVLSIEQLIKACHNHHPSGTQTPRHSHITPRSCTDAPRANDGSTAVVELENNVSATEGNVPQRLSRLPNGSADLDHVSSQPHQHCSTVESNSLLRTFMLLSALSVHSIFEGLAVGLQTTVSESVALFSALSLHKVIIAAGIGVNLATAQSPGGDEETGARRRRSLISKVISTLIFASASPLGMLIGWGLISQHSSGGLLMTTAVLQGLACGTFFFVVFCELLPDEFKDGCIDRPIKLFCLLLGFCVVSVYVYFHSE